MNENLVGKTFFCDGEEYIVEEILLFGYRCIARNLNYDTTKQFYCDSVAEWVKREKEKIEKGLNLQKQYENKINYNEKTKEELLSIISDLETIIEAKDKKEIKYQEVQQSLEKEIKMLKIQHNKKIIEWKEKYNKINEIAKNICDAVTGVIILDLETTIDDKDKNERKYHETPQSLIKEIEMSKVEHIKNDINLEKKYNETNKMVQNICNAIKHAIDEISSC